MNPAWTEGGQAESAIIDPAALALELVFLRKGRAARHPRLLARLGPQTRMLFAIGETDTAAIARQKLTRGVQSLLAQAPKELLLAATAALSLRPGADQRLLTDRYRWLADELVCDERTARRRVDEAFDHLLDVVGRRHSIHAEDQAVPSSDDAWAVRIFRAVYRLDAVTPECTEHRRIVARVDGLQRIVYPFSLYRVTDAPNLGNSIVLEELYGVRLAWQEQPIPEHFRFHLDLPRQLQRGQEHDYGLILRIPASQPVEPLYVYTPICDCKLFDLTVRFDPEDLPEVVWVLEAALPLLVEHGEPRGRLLEPDQFGEVHVQFRDLKRGLGYGLRWSL